MPKISIIMPIFNTGEILYKSLMSLMSQTEKDFELIMVDDCSTDPLTINIENTFVNFDTRFSLIKAKNNMGSSPCRNLGIQNATGKYLIVLDSDDLFVSNMLKDMSETLDDTGAEVCISNFIMQDITNDEKSVIYARYKEGITDRVFSLSELGEQALDYWMPTPWNKMFLRDYAISRKLEFQNLKNCADMYFGYASVLLSDRLVYCKNHNPLLIYRVNNPTQISYDMDSRNMIKAYELLFETMSEFDSDMRIKQLLAELLISIDDMLSRCSKASYNAGAIQGAKTLINKYGTGIIFEKEELNIRRERIFDNSMSV